MSYTVTATSAFTSASDIPADTPASSAANIGMEIYAFASIAFVALTIIGLFVYLKFFMNKKPAHDLEVRHLYKHPTFPGLTHPVAFQKQNKLKKSNNPYRSRSSWASDSTIDITPPPKAMTLTEKGVAISN